MALSKDHFDKIITRAIPVLTRKKRADVQARFDRLQGELTTAIEQTEVTKAAVQRDNGAADARAKHAEAVAEVKALQAELEGVRAAQDYANSLPAQIDCFRECWDTFADEAQLDAMIAEEENAEEERELKRLEEQLAAALQRKANRDER